jgi:hypothetical protein
MPSTKLSPCGNLSSQCCSRASPVGSGLNDEPRITAPAVLSQIFEYFSWIISFSMSRWMYVSRVERL